MIARTNNANFSSLTLRMRSAFVILLLCSYLLNSLHSEHGDLYDGLPAYLQVLQVGIIILLSAAGESASNG